MSNADIEKAFIDAVLELLKDEDDFPCLKTEDIIAATSLVKESYQGPLTDFCNFMLVFDETVRLCRIQSGYAA